MTSEAYSQKLNAFINRILATISADLKNENITPRNTSSEAFYYDMSGEKFLLLFNNKTFDLPGNIQLKNRENTQEDVDALTNVFQKMNYQVFLCEDFTYEEIMKSIEIVSTQNHSKTSSLCIAILTHGDEQNMVYTSDRAYNLRDITDLLEKGDSTLVGLPKLFFIQACRGDKYDMGIQSFILSDKVNYEDEENFNSNDSPVVIFPTAADFLYLRASGEGYISYRSNTGSFMIQELCSALENNPDKDVHYITTIVNWNVARYNIPHNTAEGTEIRVKQMPEVQHTLTKIFKFTDTSTTDDYIVERLANDSVRLTCQ